MACDAIPVTCEDMARIVTPSFSQILQELSKEGVSVSDRCKSEWPTFDVEVDCEYDEECNVSATWLRKNERKDSFEKTKRCLQGHLVEEQEDVVRTLFVQTRPSITSLRNC